MIESGKKTQKTTLRQPLGTNQSKNNEQKKQTTQKQILKKCYKRVRIKDFKKN